MHSPELDKDIHDALDLIEWLQDQLNNLFIPSSHQITCSLYYIAIQQSEGALLLLNQHREAPAFALLRPTYEHFLRGLWFSVKATPDERAEAIRNDQFPRISAIAAKFNNPDELGVVKLYEQIKLLHSYTHGGIHQIFNHINGETLESSFEPVNIKTLIDVCLRLAIASGIQMATLLGNDEIRDRISDHVQPIFFKAIV